ncbi:hypothetical protein SEA_ERUTAN_48 [Gordonia phage Erutan]|uniref:Uncharacterized protein n=1 Tax=Gordonia phage Erutan TaxID=3043913 RepID=A0AA96K521_9CAUD|nr:hypothetical protein SEA_ERUTAN_48 [Gordonia phage Erutan]
MNIPEQFEECRIYGHAWNTEEVDLSSRVYIGETLQCLRCDTYKISALQRKTGLIIKSRYIYSADYLMPRGEKFTREDRGKLRVQRILKANRKNNRKKAG